MARALLSRILVSRVLVYGVTGSGKSTLARRIGSASGPPYHPVDDLTWEPGWVEVPMDEQRRRVAAICAQDAWVLDAAYGAWIELPLARVQLVVGLDLSRGRSLRQLVQRTARRVADREAICNGNHESLRLVLSKNSILRWHVRSFANKRRRMRTWATTPQRFDVELLCNRHEVDAWLAGFLAQRSTRRSH